MKRWAKAFAILAMLFGSLLAGAVTTAYWEVDSFQQFNKGEPVEAVISSRGEVRPGLALETTALQVEGVWDILLSSSGTLFLGTGNHGKLLRLDKGKPVEDYDTKKLAVTCLAEDKQGNLYFGAIPQAVVYRRSASGQVTELAQLGADYVWTLLYDPARGLVAGTGPEGKVLAISLSGEVKTYAETGAEHVLSLVRDPEGTIYGGTSNNGLLFSISPRGKFSVEESFEENEVKRVVLLSDQTGEWFYVAANQARGRRGPAVGPPRMKKLPSPPPDKGGNSEEGEPGEEEPAEPQGEEAMLPGLKEMLAGRGPGKLNGVVYSVRLGQGKRELLLLSGAAVTDLVADSSGAVLAATDQEGKVYRIEPQTDIYAVEFDLKAEQALALELETGQLRWIGTGMTGDLFRVTGKLSERAEYYSEVFDAGFPARWGKLSRLAEGKVKIETRSGNTEEPDPGWSDWLDLPSGKEIVASPTARYLQVRARWPGQDHGVLQEFNAAYAVANQPQYVEQVDVGAAPERPSPKTPPRPLPFEPDKGKEGSSSDRDRGPQPASGPSTKLQIRWKVDNPDNDPLVYKLFYQPQGFKQWIPIRTDKEITRTRWEWDTESIPDGYYRIKVKASDEKANPPDQVQVSEKESEPFLVDNRRPEVAKLKVEKGTVTGAATDQTSPIVRLEYSLDGRDWVPVAAADGIMDEPEEEFEFQLPADTPSGPHTLAVRAFDKAENPGVNQIAFTLP
jgi:hypothetical protein